MQGMNSFCASSAEETHQIGKALASEIKAGQILAFYGDLGSGKTTLIRGIAEGIGKIDPRIVSSPTFTFLHTYEGILPLHHFDLYRLPSPEEFLLAGFDEQLYSNGICCIEWAEKISALLPHSAWKITLSYLSEAARMISVERPL